MGRLSAAVGPGRLRRHHCHPYSARPSLEAGRRTLQQVRPPRTHVQLSTYTLLERDTNISPLPAYHSTTIGTNKFGLRLQLESGL